VKRWIVVALVAGLLLASTPQVRAVVPPSITVGTWRVQIRWGDYHPLGSCVRVPVRHVHVEVFHGVGGGRYRYVVNLHVGYYVSGGRRCWVVWNSSGRPPICSKSCASGSSGLRYVVKTALIIVGAGALTAGLLAAYAAPSIMQMLQ
jgi:hypothetical protein